MTCKSCESRKGKIRKWLGVTGAMTIMGQSFTKYVGREVRKLQFTNERLEGLIKDLRQTVMTLEADAKQENRDQLLRVNDVKDRLIGIRESSGEVRNLVANQNNTIREISKELKETRDKLRKLEFPGFEKIGG